MDKQVRALIKRLQVSPPINIVGIAKVLGLNVWESKSLPDNVAGKIFADSKNGGGRGYSIVVRMHDPLVRKRFTVAHEVAHYLLHVNLFKSELIDDALYRSGLSTPVEAEANSLAAELLMPWHLLAPVADKPVSELAKVFEVSEQAMRIRLDAGSSILPATAQSDLQPTAKSHI